MTRRARGLLLLVAASCTKSVGVERGSVGKTAAVRTPDTLVPAPLGNDASADARDAASAPRDAAADAPLHKTTREELRALAMQSFGDAASDAWPSAVRAAVAPEPGRFNDGNPALAVHRVSRAACEAGLAGRVLQTPEQRRECHGKENMVPITRAGAGKPDAASAKACIDVFEFPNQACELPFVWGTPSEADRLCRAEGKRLCTQDEWTLACEGDPAGGKDRVYAYGDTLDLNVCNTNRPHPFGPDGETWACSARTAETAWATCATETEPSGAFPECRSRFGVYDLHGNVAEMMTRVGGGPEHEVLTQLKGSAFFYVDVARAPTEAQKPGGRETYPDHCRYDPRWHVEDLKDAVHSNYHLGFRCCLGL